MGDGVRFRKRRGKRMKILSLSSGDLVAMKERSPGHKKIYYTALNLSKYHRITCLNFVSIKDKAGIVRVNENMTIVKIKLYYPTLFFYLDKWKLLPFVFVHFAHRIVSGCFKKYFTGQDLIFVDNFLLSGLAPTSWDKPIVYASQNVESEWWDPVLDGVFLKQRGLNLIRGFEEKMCREYDLVFAVSEEDRRRFAELYGCGLEKNHFFPLGYEEKKREIHPVGRQRLLDAYSLPEDKKRVLFCGSDFYANREIIDIIFNIVAHGLKDDILLLIAGSIENYIRSAHPSPPGNVRVLGFVDDIHDIYGISDLAINPVMSGGGANLKTIEYLSAGLPLVTTKFGVRGYESLAEIMKIAPPESMADAINQHFSQQDADVDFSALQSYEWGAIAERINEVLLAVRERRIVKK